MSTTAAPVGDRLARDHLQRRQSPPGGTDATALERRQAAGADVKRAAAIHATPHRGGLIVR